MSSIRINGVLIMSTQDQVTTPVNTKGSVSVVEPSFATHKLIDGNWVPKGSAPAPVVTPAKPAIGFIQPAPQPITPVNTKGSVSYLGSRKEYLRAIEVAAGHTLLKGTNTKAIEAIRRGRLGGRKDNMSELHALLVEYSS